MDYIGETWEDLIEHGTISDLELAADRALDRGDPVPFDVVVKLAEHGIYL